MEKLTSFWRGEAAKLRGISLERFRSDPTVRYNVNSDPVLFENARDELIRHHGPLQGKTVLEIGPGIGNICNLLLAEGVASYTVVDHEPMLRLFAYAVGDYEIGRRVRMVNVDKIELSTFEDTFDLFISTSCLSEVPVDYLDYVLQNLASRCAHLFVLDGPTSFKDSLAEKLKEWFTVTTYPTPWNQRYDAHIVTGHA
jgi:SAM-dependent methyltransferase